MIPGYDILGHGHKRFPIKPVLNLLTQPTALGGFALTFGSHKETLPEVREALSHLLVPAYRTHIWWDDNHKIVPVEFLKKHVVKYEQIAKEFPHKKVYVSHSCEYNENSLAVIRERVDIIRTLAPHCIPVNAVWRGPTMSGVLTERHGSEAKGDIVSTDGINAYDIDILRYFERNQNAEIAFVWGHLNNLREITKPGQKPPKPKARTKTPSKQYHASMLRLTLPIGEPKAFIG